MYRDAGNNVVRIEDEHYNSKALLLETIMKNFANCLHTHKSAACSR